MTDFIVCVPKKKKNTPDEHGKEKKIHLKLDRLESCSQKPKWKSRCQETIINHRKGNWEEKLWYAKLLKNWAENQ